MPTTGFATFARVLTAEAANVRVICAFAGSVQDGTMAERTIAPVLKTGSPQGSGVRIPLVPPSN